MAYPADSVMTKDWGNEVLTDTDLEGQFNVIHTYINALLNASTGHTHDGTTNEGGTVDTSQTLTAKTSSYTVTAANCNGSNIYTNNGAGAEITFTLPSGSAGYMVTFMVTDAQYLKVLAVGAQKFRFLATLTAAGGYIRSDTVGDNVTLIHDGDNWVIQNISGSWNYDE